MSLIGRVRLLVSGCLLAALIVAVTPGAGATLAQASFVQQSPKLLGSGETGGGYFGYRVALSADGNTALIGGSDGNVSARPGCSRARARPGRSRA